jgi:DNA-binding beta-propeller fold protein YncE
MPPECLAVSDDGNALAFCSGEGRVSVLTPDGTLTSVYSGVEAAALAFLPDLSKLLVCDPGRSAVYLINGLLGMPSTSPVALGLDISTRPVFLAASRDGGEAVVASARSNRAWSINISSAVLEAIDLPAPAASLLPLSSSGVFLLSARPAEPGWLLVKKGAAFQIAFVPALTLGSRAPQPRPLRGDSGGKLR